MASETERPDPREGLTEECGLASAILGAFLAGIILGVVLSAGLVAFIGGP